MAWNFDEKPLLVFWETTRSCGLACKHCRAAAQETPLPGELSYEEGIAFIDSLASFGRPSPILIMTGGDVLRRQRIWDLVKHARDLKIPVAMSPSVTPLLTEEAIQKMVELGVETISLSLDSSSAEKHDGLRGYPGTWEKTLYWIRTATAAGIKVQINTTVMSWNIDELPEIFEQISEAGAKIWEVFFLIYEGRGTHMEAASPQQCEAVCRFLVEASGYGLIVRTVEAPFFRRLVEQPEPPDGLARKLIDDLQQRMGEPSHRPRNKSAYTRDGKGIVFISHKGDVSPSGFLPMIGGNLRERTLAEIYQDSDLFKNLRLPQSFKGRCGSCEFSDLCGGSRARAYSYSGDPLGEDPACVYQPALAQRS